MKGIQQEQTEAIEKFLIPENPVQEKADARFESAQGGSEQQAAATKGGSAM
jgi:hypothetical protein